MLLQPYLLTVAAVATAIPTAMNTQTDPALPVEPLRYHTHSPGGLFRPITFGFVTPRMCSGILEERHRILNLVPRSRLAEQVVLFGRYDPQQSAERFQALLRPFLIDSAKLQMA
ncbi:MAG: hypothetical protein ROZ37_19985 [Aromatoleum sp.]|jgi:hypothetical protein|uniref:hypothetical protein n=1 Tax=Aromatoleum sp. TaxID=2307007 RepID=UPI0028941DDB|nr:hypothetical protein [Aromatoleum sp.]MDT3672609.1 hypothetical protein [Aromatoleum sp.]